MTIFEVAYWLNLPFQYNVCVTVDSPKGMMRAKFSENGWC